MSKKVKFIDVDTGEEVEVEKEDVAALLDIRESDPDYKAILGGFFGFEVDDDE